jgi:hypothetical protein
VHCLSILAVACSIYSARQSRRALAKKTHGRKKVGRTENARRQPVRLPHTPSAAILSWEEYFRRSWKKLFLAASSVCLLIHDEAIRGYNSARLFSNAGRYLAKAKERAVTSSSAASRTHTFERTHPPDTMAEETETFAFQAEINQLLSLIINVSTSPPRHARFPTPPMPAI